MMKEYFLSIGEKKFRGEQVFNWIYNHLALDFDEMLNISKGLRQKLSDGCEIHSLTLDKIQNSVSGTKKYLLTTKDDKKIESVIIPDKDRNTLCISTQVGCPLDCKFCATGQLGFRRNLTTGEIVDQYLFAAKDCGKESVKNIVYMGMGEPLLNYDALMTSLKIFTAETTETISRKRITVSTSGVANRIKDLADSGLRVKLALSLHSCFEDIRSKIMPINNKYSLADVVDAVKYYARETKTRITFEYTMMKGINDRSEDLKALTRLCSIIPSKVNLIPFNSIAHMNPSGISAELEPTPPEKFEAFANKLRDKNITVMVRDTQGDDIAAACGQLAAKDKLN